jgi:hypothetical protein
MKKTLQEEKEKILAMMRKLTEQSDKTSNVENIQTHEVVGTFQYGIGFVPNEIGKKQGLQPNKVTIPGGTTRIGGEQIPLLRDIPDDGKNDISKGFKTTVNELKTSEIAKWVKEQKAKGLTDSQIEKLFDKLHTKKTKQMDEGNAFVAAAHKAKEAGKDSFEVGGKTYKVK